LPHDTKPEIFDPVTHTWSNWSLPPSPMCYACFVSWKNYIYQFGGPHPAHSRKVYRYDPLTGTWAILSTQPPFDIYRSGCVTLPNGNILVVGSMASSIFAYSEYNVRRNIWSPIIIGGILQHEPTPLVLGRRVFVIPSLAPKPVEEYFYRTQSVHISTYNFNIKTSYKPAVVAVPARWFLDIPGGCFGIK